MSPRKDKDMGATKNLWLDQQQERVEREALRHGVSLEEWEGFERDQAAFAEEEHRGRVALPSGDDSEIICNRAKEAQH